MFRSIMIFTGLLCVLLLGTLVVVQVQRGVHDHEETTADAETDLLPVNEADQYGLQYLPDQPALSYETADAATPPPQIEPPASLDADPNSFPANFPPPPAGFPPIQPAAAAAEPEVTPPPGTTTQLPDPPPVESTELRGLIPELGEPETTLPPFDTVISGRPTTPPATTKTAEPLETPKRLIDPPQLPPTLGVDDDELFAIPEEITPDASRPSTEAAPTDNQLIGTATVAATAPRGVQKPQLEIEKTAPASSTIGEPLIYTIRVRNTGSITAESVIVRDPIARGARLSGTDPQAEFAEGILSWDLGAIAPNSEKKIQVLIIPTAAGAIGSTATVRFTAQTSAVTQVVASGTAGDTATPTIPERPISLPSRPVADSPLSITVNMPLRIQVGKTLTMSFIIKNNTATDAVDIVLRDIIPAEFEHPAGHDLEYPLAKLVAGGTKVIELKLLAKKPGRAVNRAVLSVSGKEVSRDEDTITIEAPGPVEIEQAFPASGSVGGTTSMKTSIVNTTGRPIAPATVIQTLPAGVDFLKATGNASYDPVNGQVTWALSSMQAGVTQTFEVTVQHRFAKSLTSLVRVKSAGKTLAESVRSMTVRKAGGTR